MELPINIGDRKVRGLATDAIASLIGTRFFFNFSVLSFFFLHNLSKKGMEGTG